MGRPRKPTTLKVLEGNPGKRPLPKNEPKPTIGAEAPPWMTAPGARAEWERIAPRLLRLGLLTEIDAEAFALLCGHLADAGEQMGLARPVDPRLTSEIRQFLSQFGMTPASRSKVAGAGKPPEEEDPFAQWKVSSGGKKG
jgi:phage terminase small subunit